MIIYVTIHVLMLVMIMVFFVVLPMTTMIAMAAVVVLMVVVVIMLVPMIMLVPVPVPVIMLVPEYAVIVLSVTVPEVAMVLTSLGNGVILVNEHVSEVVRIIAVVTLCFSVHIDHILITMRTDPLSPLVNLASLVRDHKHLIKLPKDI